MIRRKLSQAGIKGSRARALPQSPSTRMSGNRRSGPGFTYIIGSSDRKVSLVRIEALDDARRLQLLIDGVVDYAVYLITPEGRIASWNTGAQRVKGYEASEIIGCPYATLFTAEDQKAGLPDTALKTAAAKGRWEQEGWRVRKDGTRFWAMAVLDAVYDDAGNVIGYAKITRDITERLKARERLNESEDQFGRLVNAVIDYAIFQLDPKGNILTWNSGAQRIKGYSADEIVGQHFSRFYTEEDRRSGLPEKGLATAAHEGRFESEGWRVRKDGSRFRALVVIDPIRDDSGRLVGFAKVTRDVTDNSKRSVRYEKPKSN